VAINNLSHISQLTCYYPTKEGIKYVHPGNDKESASDWLWFVFGISRENPIVKALN